jgi:hypothetical protein
LNQIEWDISTVTAGDYTVDLKISPQMFQTFLNDYRQQYFSLDTLGYGLKRHIKEELENMLTGRVPSLGFESVDRIRIADIHFCYKNGELIRVLKNRGITIQNNDWAGLKHTNLELDRVKALH